MLKPFLASLTLIILVSCGGRNTPSNVDTPGDYTTPKDKTLNTGADLLQDKTPLKKFNAYLNGFHFYNGNISAQMEAHHYVDQLSEDFYQAIIFDGNDRDAKLMGVEYIITPKLFAELDTEEKKLWHSHHYEVKSGGLIAPGIGAVPEKELMEKLISTYGKTIHTWHTDQGRPVPIGSPMIMMGFTKDGQLNQRLIDSRDKRFDVSTAKIKEQRKNIPLPTVDPMANAWEKGEIRQLTISKNRDSAAHKHSQTVKH